MTSSLDTLANTASFDRLLQAWQACFTAGLSPASLTLAYLDWLVHLSNTPGKQAHLVGELADLAGQALKRAWGGSTAG